MAGPATPDLLTLTAQVVAAHVAGNKLQADEIPAPINDVYGALAREDDAVVPAPAPKASGADQALDPARLLGLP